MKAPNFIIVYSFIQFVSSESCIIQHDEYRGNERKRSMEVMKINDVKDYLVLYFDYSGCVKQRVLSLTTITADYHINRM